MANIDHKQERWSTEELFPAIGSQLIKQAIDTLNSKVGAVGEFRAQLNPQMAPKAFVEVLEKYEEMIRLVSRLAAYGQLKFTEDTQDQAAQTFQAQMHQLLAEVDNQTLFFKLWWKGLDAEAADDRKRRRAEPLVDRIGQRAQGGLQRAPDHGCDL